MMSQSIVTVCRPSARGEAKRSASNDVMVSAILAMGWTIAVMPGSWTVKAATSSKLTRETSRGVRRSCSRIQDKNPIVML